MRELFKNRINLIIATLLMSGGVGLWVHGYTYGLQKQVVAISNDKTEAIQHIVQEVHEDEAFRQSIRSLPDDVRKRELSRWMR